MNAERLASSGRTIAICAKMLAQMALFIFEAGNDILREDR